MICFRLFSPDFLLHLFGILGILLILTVENQCFQIYFNAVSLVMFEWIAMFMPVSDALLSQWLTIMGCCTCLVSNSRSFHALPNLNPRSNFDQFKWIRTNYCLSFSFPWSASPCEIWHLFLWGPSLANSNESNKISPLLVCTVKCFTPHTTQRYPIHPIPLIAYSASSIWCLFLWAVAFGVWFPVI